MDKAVELTPMDRGASFFFLLLPSADATFRACCIFVVAMVMYIERESIRTTMRAGLPSLSFNFELGRREGGATNKKKNAGNHSKE